MTAGLSYAVDIFTVIKDLSKMLYNTSESFASVTRVLSFLVQHCVKMISTIILETTSKATHSIYADRQRLFDF